MTVSCINCGLLSLQRATPALARDWYGICERSDPPAHKSLTYQRECRHHFQIRDDVAAKRVVWLNKHGRKD